MAQMPHVDGCLICGLETADPATVVFRDQRWAAQTVPGYDVPGWFFLRTRRHAERLTGLNEDELTTLGRRARDLTAAVTTVTGAPATYLFVFGENYPHFHAVITPRGEQVPEDRRSGEILKLRTEHADPAAAIQLVSPVRDAYQQLAPADSGVESAQTPQPGSTASTYQ